MKSLIIAIVTATLMVSSPAFSELELEGRMEQGGMVVGQTEAGAEIFLDGRRVRVGDDGQFVFGLSWDAPQIATIDVSLPDGSRERLKLTIKPQEYRVERIDGLPPKTVTIPEEERRRRTMERAMVVKARAGNTDLRDWRSRFRRPAEGRISGVYGSYRILNGRPRSPHFGLDIAAPKSTPIVAPAGGVVTLAEKDFLLEGGIVIIDHGFGVTSTLFHMNTVEVEKGQSVQAGQLIGTIGATGRASGPHVDWRVNWLDVRLDPALLLDSLEQ